MTSQISAHQSSFQTPISHPTGNGIHWHELSFDLSASIDDHEHQDALKETVTTMAVGETLRSSNGFAAAIDASYQSALFDIPHDARQVYLLIGHKDGGSQALHQMEADDEGRWRLALRLQPGAYRYRYYADHGVIASHRESDLLEDLPIKIKNFNTLLNVTTTSNSSA